MMNLQNALLSILMLVASFTSVIAQRSGGGRPGGDPQEMISREKQALYEQITDLSDAQKELLDGIYEEFGVTLQETFQEPRQSGDREARREKMQALLEEKNELIADVLSEDQYAIYTELTTRRGRRKEAATEGDSPN
ncbi:hypothetical protein [Tunicatimonas pelagia]|uniref:hypothetical protein n=1 Tax=Tunicatimonas pelagia TaxID=931531 RepID=UPI0026662DB8|nr:hypothetical protein [Tunicatimonas pelagia]WKN42740.1 hypothetical protein P0M28_27260 [Tunicatimonas pelagia]